MNTRVIQELNCLYFSVDVQQKQASSVFLQQFQSSPEAWEISRLLLLESSIISLFYLCFQFQIHFMFIFFIIMS